MSSLVAYLRFGSVGLLAAGFAVVFLGCGARSQPPAVAASGSDTSTAAPAGAASGSDPSAAVAAAQTFLATLSDAQHTAATFPFGDPERINWAYVPRRRAGIPLRAMNAEQRAAAIGLLGSGLSERGAELARGITELEGTLRLLEEAAGSPMAATRDPELYYVSLFGVPSAAEPWGWRFEGHHLSVNVTELGPHGQVVAPLFMGVNPARVPRGVGAQAGLRLLAAEEDLAFELLHMLDPRQRARATISARPPGDIVTRDDPAVRPMAFAGLPAAAMTAAQQRQLRQLLEVYAGRMADGSARSQVERIEEVGFERLHFGWAGAHRSGQPHYYRIHGPTVLIEYDNSQNNANHIHTVWRDLENDFGGDLLRKHHAQHAHRH